jgi:tetratricopeptide (TPR) repeat protein
MMKTYQLEDFKYNKAWLIFRVDIQVQNKSVDAYFILDLPSELLLAHEIVEDTISEPQITNLLNLAQNKAQVPKQIIIAYGDPAQECLLKLSERLHFELELVPAPYLEPLLSPVKQTFGAHFFSPTSIAHMVPEHEIGQYTGLGTREDLINTIPDSYAPCPCNSGKKYKFCCKPIFREITECMCAAEDGNLLEALELLEKARKIVGTTGEILCREAIIYSYFNHDKYLELRNKCLNKFPTYPRVHYIHGIDLRNSNDIDGAIKAYKTAISLYPNSDQYHLNEAYYNLGNVLYDKHDLQGAKEAWEKALFFMPSDKDTLYNLNEFIYKNTNSQNIYKL